MNCTIIQRRLLGTEDPAHPPDEIQTHLDGCSGCRDWHALLLQVEQHVPLLPVPPSDSKAEFLQRLLHTPAAISANGTGPPLQIRVPELVRRRAQSAGPQRFNRVVREWMPVVGAAAALVLIVFGWSEFVTPRRAGTPSELTAQAAADPLVAKLMASHLDLVKAENGQSRADALNAMVRALEPERLALARVPTAKKLADDLTELERKLVQSGSLPQHLIGADNPSTLPATAERIVQLQHNRALIHQIVNNSVKRSASDDPLSRAALCEGLVKQLAQEITQAARHSDGKRALEMTGHLDQLVRMGVIENLQNVRELVAGGGSVARREITTLVLDTTRALEKELAASEVADMQTALRMLTECRMRMETLQA